MGRWRRMQPEWILCIQLQPRFPCNAVTRLLTLNESQIETIRIQIQYVQIFIKCVGRSEEVFSNRYIHGTPTFTSTTNRLFGVAGFHRAARSVMCKHVGHDVCDVCERFEFTFAVRNIHTSYRVRRCNDYADDVIFAGIYILRTASAALSYEKHDSLRCVCWFWTLFFIVYVMHTNEENFIYSKPYLWPNISHGSVWKDASIRQRRVQMHLSANSTLLGLNCLSVCDGTLKYFYRKPRRLKRNAHQMVKLMFEVHTESKRIVMIWRWVYSQNPHLEHIGAVITYINVCRLCKPVKLWPLEHALIWQNM